MKNLLITAALLASLGSAHAATNIVVNGSFEDQTQAPGTFTLNPSLTGWTLVSGPNIEVRNQLVGNAFNGSNYVELDSLSNSAMAQTLATTVGQNYTLSFEYSGRAAVPSASNPIEVLWDGVSIATATADGTGQAGNVWTQYNFNVVGTGNDTLTFRAVGTNDAVGGSLDAVSITAAVPEPSTYALMVAGLGLIGFSARKRRAQR
jgi:hypothetical protein